MNMEMATVEKSRNSYLVTNENDMCIKVSSWQVDAIAERSDESDKNKIATLLATIKEARIMTAAEGNAYKKINDDTGVESLIELLTYHTVEELSSIFQSSRYFEIKHVLEAEDPEETLYEIL